MDNAFRNSGDDLYRSVGEECGRDVLFRDVGGKCCIEVLGRVRKRGA